MLPHTALSNTCNRDQADKDNTDINKTWHSNNCTYFKRYYDP